MSVLRKLNFYIGCITGDDERAGKFADTANDLLNDLNGKSVAIVGNARALTAHNYGSAIDSADIVVRINRAPMPAPKSHGTRTTWLALATRIDAAKLDLLTPMRVLWMSHKRKRLSYSVATKRGFYLHSHSAWEHLHELLGEPPSTGMMVIDMVAGSKADKIEVFGFDFFASKSLSGSRNANDVPHDFEAEARWVSDLLSRDERITLHPL